MKVYMLGHDTEPKSKKTVYFLRHMEHVEMASKMFGVPVEEVTREQREKAKRANFIYNYGFIGESSKFTESMSTVVNDWVKIFKDTLSPILRNVSYAFTDLSKAWIGDFFTVVVVARRKEDVQHKLIWRSHGWFK